MKRVDGSPLWLDGNEHGNPGGYVRNTSHPEGHDYKDTGITVFDSVECECGWKSQSYWDGMDLALNDWDKHLAALDKK